MASKGVSMDERSVSGDMRRRTYRGADERSFFVRYTTKVRLRLLCGVKERVQSKDFGAILCYPKSSNKRPKRVQVMSDVVIVKVDKERFT